MNNIRMAKNAILVLPDEAESEYSGIQLSGPKTEVPTGVVVEAGSPPKGFPRLKKGDRIVYAKSVQVSLTVNLDGQEKVCRVLTYFGYRGKFVLNEHTTIWDRIIRSPFMLGFASGSIIGAIFRNQLFTLGKAFISAKVNNIFGKRD